MSITVARHKFKYFHQITLLALCSVLIKGCASDTSFDRHNLSRLWQPQGEATIYFDASTNSQYPLESATAEATRKEWIAQWLKLRNMCQQGHVIVGKRAISRSELNPHRHDQRYTIECIHSDSDE